MTTTALVPATPTDSPQERLSQNIVQVLALRGTSRAALARQLQLDPAGVSRRLIGGVAWNLQEVQQAAAFLHVPWAWLFLPLPELLAKCTAPDLNRQPADYMRTALRQVAGGSASSSASASSPRVSTSRLGLVRPRWGAASASAPRRVA